MKSMLNRDDTPFGSTFWERLDSSIVEFAKKKLSARKILETESLQGDNCCIPCNYKREKLANGIEAVVPQGKPLVQFFTKFSLSASQIDYFARTGIETGIDGPIKAVNVMCEQEDRLLFNGLPEFGMQGILNISGTHTVTFSNWDSSGAATDSILSGVEVLDKAGFHGPYSCVLSALFYSKLFRKYPQSSLPEIVNVNAVIEDGIVKSGMLDSAGILIASGTDYASIVVGQDLAAGFEGPSGIDYIFTLSESLTLKVNAPDAICLLKVK